MRTRGSEGRRSKLLIIGVALTVIGCVLIVKPFAAEPLWAEWLLGFALFYVGVPLTMAGTAIQFFGYTGLKDPFSPPANAPESRKRAV